MNLDESKSYSYLIDGRGRLMTDYLNISNDIAKYAVTNKQFVKVDLFLPDGSRKPVKLPPLLNSEIDKYWLPRSKLINILQASIYRTNGTAINSVFGDDPYKYPIEMIFDVDFQSMNFIKNDTDQNLIVSVTLKDQRDGQIKLYEKQGVDLIVACDGINSIVRQELLNYNKSSPTSLLSTNVDFRTTSYDSPAAGTYIISVFSFTFIFWCIKY